MQNYKKDCKNLHIRFACVVTSPLKRTIDSGRIIVNTLSIPQQVNPYLKEKNGYGLLSGLNRDFAKRKYLELVQALEDGYVYGAEPHDKFVARMIEGIKRLLQLNQQNKMSF